VFQTRDEERLPGFPVAARQRGKAMVHEALDSSFHSLIDENAPARLVASGFAFAEGPVWHPKEHFLIFSDIPGDARYRWDEKGVKKVAKPSNKGNGMTYDKALNLLVCEHAISSVVRFSGRKREVLASHFEGRELNSPNDIVVGKDGSIYFSDPTYGRMPVFGVERPVQLGFQGVYRIASGGDPQLLVEKAMFSQPNGLCFSPDERLLYVNDTEQMNIRVFEVQAEGLKSMRIFASGIGDPDKVGVPDGMKCDAEGNIWVTAPAGLWVYAPDGRLIGKVAIPENSGNLHWGGADWRTLFVTASTSVYALDVKVGPHKELFMHP
jgi:gluconolactonase